MYRYAQLDENNVVIGESFLSGKVVSDRMILLTDEKIEVGNTEYIDGKFVVKKPQPEPQKQTTVHIGREDFDLLDVTYKSVIYHITEEDGTITMKRGEE